MAGKRYKVGDVAWAGRFEPYSQKQVLCPVCCGNEVVHLILGDGTTIELPCSFCSAGFGPPTGKIIERSPVSRAEKVYIHEVRIVETTQGQSCEYLSGSYLFNEDNLFDTEEEAIEHAEKKGAEWEANQLNQAEHIKKDQHRSYTWNAGYHLTEAKKLRKKADRHEELAKVCKSRQRS